MGEELSHIAGKADQPFGAGIIFLILVHPVYKM
jgi:hypothetical protein